MLKLLKTIVDLLVLLNQILSSQYTLTPIRLEEEVWLDSNDVQRKFKISGRTLYRRRVNGDFVTRKNGGKWYYAETSVKRHFD